MSLICCRGKLLHLILLWIYCVFKVRYIHTHTLIKAVVRENFSFYHRIAFLESSSSFATFSFPCLYFINKRKRIPINVLQLIHIAFPVLSALSVAWFPIRSLFMENPNKNLIRLSRTSNQKSKMYSILRTSHSANQIRNNNNKS